MDMIIPPLRVKIMLESNPPKSKMLVGRLAVTLMTIIIIIIHILILMIII